MSELTRILAQIESGAPSDAEKLLLLADDELQYLAATAMRRILVELRF